MFATATIDHQRLRRNVQLLREAAAPAELCVVLKANAYGHGWKQIADTVISAGAKSLAVANVEEAVAVRRAGHSCEVLILTEPRAVELEALVENEITPVLYSPGAIAALQEVAAYKKIDVGLHLKIDTGMNRVGIKSPDGFDDFESSAASFELLVKQITDSSNLFLAGICTHFATADIQGHEYTLRQLQRFGELQQACADAIEVASKGQSRVVHVANSAATLSGEVPHFDMVRCGLASYGVAPAAWLKDTVAGSRLQPVMSIHTEIGMVKRVKPDERVSYGLKHRFKQDGLIGVIRIGYADGVRRNSAKAGVEVLVAGVRCPIVGVVTMDQTMVDLSPALDAGEGPFDVGEKVTLIGDNAGKINTDIITVDEVAERLGTIPWEILCSIGYRVIREHIY